MEDVFCGPLLNPETDVAVDEDDAQDEPEESGQAKPNTRSKPYTPSRQEIMEHTRKDLPYRNWCAASEAKVCHMDARKVRRTMTRKCR